MALCFDALPHFISNYKLLLLIYFRGYSSVKTGQRRVDPSAVIFNKQRQNQTGNGQQAITGISEAEQRRKQYQAGVEVTSTGSEFQGKAVRGSGGQSTQIKYLSKSTDTYNKILLH